MKACTPLWREAHFQVKMYKPHQVRTTFGSCDVEKVHAVVAQSTFPSQNVQNTSAPNHFWKLRCRKSARRCGAKHISKSTCTKHTRFGPLLEVEMSKKCTQWPQAHFEVKSAKNWGVRNTFWRSDVVSRVRDCAPCQKWANQEGFVAFSTTTTTTLHYTPLHYNYNYNFTWTTFHHTTLHYATLHYTPLHSTTFHYNPLHYTTLHYTILHSTTLHYNYTTLHSTTLHYITPHYTPVHSTTLQYTPVHSTTLHYTTLNYTTLHYIPLHYTNHNYNYTCNYNYITVRYTTLFTLHYTPLHSTPLHYTTLNDTTIHLQLQLQLQLQLHYITLHYTNYITLHYTTLH